MAVTAHIIKQPIDGTTSNASYVFFHVKEILKQNGWTVAGSSNGSVGGMDGVDRIDSFTVLYGTNRWFVLESPHGDPVLDPGGSVGDKVYLLFGNNSASVSVATSSGRFGMSYTKPTGTGSAFPSMGDGHVVTSVESSQLNTGVSIHMSVGDADEKFQFGMFATVPGKTLLGVCSMLFLHLDQLAPYSDGKRYAFYNSWVLTPGSIGVMDGRERLGCWWNLFGKSNNSGLGGGVWLVPYGENLVGLGSCSTLVSDFTITKNSYTNNTSIYWPGFPCGVRPDENGREVTAPMLICSFDPSYLSRCRYIGMASNFARLNGQIRSNLDCVGVGGDAYDRICCRYYSFKWDGVTRPES